jgi:hypothetical protein
LNVKVFLASWLWLALMLQTGLCKASEPAPGIAPDIRVLIISYDKGAGYAGGIRKLLDDHGIAALVMAHHQVTPAKIEPFSLVIVTGTGGNTRPEQVLQGCTRPILGYGCFGCDYFGQLQLKNGSPYT